MSSFMPLTQFAASFPLHPLLRLNNTYLSLDPWMFLILLVPCSAA